MTTPHARPSYISRNTDGGPLNEPVASEQKDLNSDERGLDKEYPKADIEVDIQNGEIDQHCSTLLISHQHSSPILRLLMITCLTSFHICTYRPSVEAYMYTWNCFGTSLFLE